MIIQKGSDLTLTIDSNATKIRVFTTNRNVYIEKTVTNYSDLILNFIGTEYTNYYYKDADLNKTLIETLDANISLITSDIKTKLDKLTAGTGIEITTDNTINCTLEVDPSDVVLKRATLIKDCVTLEEYDNITTKNNSTVYVVNTINN